MVRVPCPLCEGKGELKFDREEEALPLHHPPYASNDTETTKEKIYVCSNCGAEFHENDYNSLREEARNRESGI